MARRYVFADEAGNFDFSRKNGATKYFILGTLTVDSPELGDDLLELRRELAWQGVGLETSFHATEDKQVVRDAVFAKLAASSFRIDFTVFEKAKTVPRRQLEEPFYKLAWFEHMKHVGPRIAKQTDELMVVAASLGTKKKRRTMRLAVEDVVNQTTLCQDWQVAFWPCESDPCLQAVDYCTWAVQRKWEQGDPRSYDLIKHHIMTEYDFFSWGSKRYY